MVEHYHVSNIDQASIRLILRKLWLRRLGCWVVVAKAVGVLRHRYQWKNCGHLESPCKCAIVSSMEFEERDNFEKDNMMIDCKILFEIRHDIIHQVFSRRLFGI
jgi:hypothetical protein